MPKLVCNITGNKYYVTKEQLNKKIKSSGQKEERFFDLYISRKAKTLLQRGYSVDEIRTLTGAPEGLRTISEKDLQEIIDSFHTSNVNRILSNFESISSLAANHTDDQVKILIENLKK